MKAITDNIKRFREIKNLTRDQLASELDMSLSGYSKLERGEVELTVSRLYQIAEVLQVPPSEILNFDASRVFNISNNNIVNGIEVSTQHIHHDDYREKYIKMLEEEINRLKSTK
jgi:transcriptional regulator with XRE-family HTH domain